MDFTKMHPFQLAVLGGFALLALIGLFLFATYSGFGGDKIAVGEVTIWGTLPEEQMQQGIHDMATAHKEYGNVSYVEKNTAAFDAELAEALASGTGPDLIIITQEQLLAQMSKITLIEFSSLPERTFRDTYVPVFEHYLTEKGMYGIPFVVDPLVLYYNRDMLESAGIPTPPRTWEAVVGLSALLTRKLPDQTVTRSLIGLGEYENVTNARALVSLLLMQSGSSMTAVNSNGKRRATLDGGGTDDLGLTPAQSALSFYTQFANPSKTVYSWNRSLPSSRDAFLAGDVALYPGFASERRLLRAGNPNLNFDMATMPQPQTADRRMTYGLAYAFAIPRASGNANGAFRAASMLSSKEVAPLVAAQLGMAPALRGALRAAPDDRWGAVYLPEALAVVGWLSPAPRITDTILGTMIGNITTGRRSVSDALFTANQALDAAL